MFVKPSLYDFARAQIIGLVVLSNIIWIVFPMIAMYASYQLIMNDNPGTNSL
eukprot:Pgem_evm1s17992